MTIRQREVVLVVRILITQDELDRLSMSAATTTSLLTSIVKARCPRCRGAAMFRNALYSKRFMEMEEQCTCCGQPFKLEPGFFLGSAYFSYFIYALVLSGVALAWYYSGFGIPTAAIIVVMLLSIGVLLPIVLRISKSIWIHIFVPYDGPCDQIPRKG